MAGVLRLPHKYQAGTKYPAVVMCAGFSLVKEVWLPLNAQALNDAGYVTLNFDYRTFGESGGEPRCRLVPQMQVQDVRNALSFLHTRPEVDHNKLGLYGMSLGASVALGAAGVDDRVKAMVAVAGPSDLYRVWSAFPTFDGFKAKVLAARHRFAATGEVSYISVLKLLSSDPETCALLDAESKKFPTWRLEVTFESLEHLFEFRPEQTAALISPNASLFIYPGAGQLVDKAEVRSGYAAAREPKRVIGLDSIRHAQIYNDGPGFQPIMDHTVSFFGEYLV